MSANALVPANNDARDNASADGQVDVAQQGAQAAEAEQGQQQQQQQGINFFGVAKTLLIRALFIYFITGFFRQKPQTGAPQAMGPLKPSSNLFSNGTEMDLYVYVSESEISPNFSDPDELIWRLPNLVYGDWHGGENQDGSYTMNTEITASEAVQNNGSIWLHTYIVLAGNSPNPEHRSRYSRIYTVHKTKRLNRYKKKQYLQTLNLLTGETAKEEVVEKQKQGIKEEVLSHWHPNLTINIVDDHTAWVQGQVPQPLDEFIEFEPTTGKYYPVVYLNDYWNLYRDYQPINETTKYLPLNLEYKPLSMFRWQMYTAQLMRSKWGNMLGQDMFEESEEEQDSMKEMFLETSPYLLALTIVVAIVHSIFEFLAFKNDIQFWNNRRSLEGLSVRSVFFNVFQSLIVMLYILDNDTSFLIKVSVFIGLLIEVWKIHKVVNIEIRRDQPVLGVFPRIVFSDKGSYVESSTKQYDMMAFKYLSWVLFPLLGGYAVYSLLYLEHKGWYSWVLGMLYSFLLTFGFIMMTPQLFINYKLKSVAHLPWRMLTYKFLNTFIDDIFAFVIKMPTMYRLGCFRDDIVFFIYLYQRWIYRVDPKRVNEFGTSGEMENAVQQGDGDAVMANGDLSLPEPEPRSDKKND